MSFSLPAAKRDRAIVLVHGAWVGEWSWLPVLPHFSCQSRPVVPVSLTGHGTRSHQSGPHVTLADHVSDVVGAIETFDLTNVTLVAHSYGGRVITQVAAKVPERIAAVVYLDAHTPVTKDPGQSKDRRAQAQANGGMLPFVAYDPSPELVGGNQGVDWFMARTMPQSFACFTADWLVELPKNVRKTFVYATNNEPSRFAQYRAIVKDDPGWNYVELDGPHWLMFSHPTEVADLILNA